MPTATEMVQPLIVTPVAGASVNLRNASIPAAPTQQLLTVPLPFGQGSGPDADPRPVAFSKTAVTAPAHDLAVFERIHVIPREYDFGAVLTDQEKTVEVWNAFRSRAKINTDITIAGPQGIVLPSPPTLPDHYPATESKLHTVRALADGDPFIDNLVTWVFTGVDPDGTDLHLLGFRMQPWSFEPNYGEPYEMLYGYLTNIIKAFDESEQRIGLRRIPVGSLNQQFVFGELREAQMANAIIYGSQARPIGVPLFMWSMPLVSASVIGDTEIMCDTANNPFLLAGGLVFLWKDPYTWEAQRIESVAADRVVTTLGLRNNWDTAGVFVMPLVIGRLSADEKFTWKTLTIGKNTVTFDIDGWKPAT